jgi:UDP-glucose 4-epimerase
MVYGQGAKGNLLSLYKLIRLSPILPFNFDLNHRSIVYVKNLTHFIDCTISQKKSGIFLPQDKKTVSIKDLAQMIARAVGKKLFLFRLPGFIQSILEKVEPKIMARLFGTLAMDSTSTNIQLQYQPKYTSLEGIKKALS